MTNLTFTTEELEKLAAALRMWFAETMPSGFAQERHEALERKIHQALEWPANDE